jgi:uncharacterized membrane protein
MTKTYILPFVLAVFFALAACTSMTPTQQGAASGGILGAGAGAGISALSGGNAGIGALIGGAAGAVAGGLVGYEKERRESY